MAEVKLHVISREEKGKQAAKELRRKGLIPAILYGKGKKSSALSVNEKELIELLHSHGRNTIVNIIRDEDKDQSKTFIYDVQHDPITGNIIHIDFKHISMKETIHVSVRVRLEGVPEGVKNDSGITEHIMHTLEVKCLPNNIPEEFVIDISSFNIGDAIHVRDIEQDNFEFISDLDRTVVHVIAPKVVQVEEEVEEEAAEIEEGIEEAPEPEVIGKKEEE